MSKNNNKSLDYLVQVSFVGLILIPTAYFYYLKGDEIQAPNSIKGLLTIGVVPAMWAGALTILTLWGINKIKKNSISSIYEYIIFLIYQVILMLISILVIHIMVPTIGWYETLDLFGTLATPGVAILGILIIYKRIKGEKN